MFSLIVFVLRTACQCLCELFIQPNNVIYFIHDRASYMTPAGDPMQKDFRYPRPLWALAPRAKTRSKAGGPTLGGGQYARTPVRRAEANYT